MRHFDLARSASRDFLLSSKEQHPLTGELSGCTFLRALGAAPRAARRHADEAARAAGGVRCSPPLSACSRAGSLADTRAGEAEGAIG